jgi:hypothetical protein
VANATTFHDNITVTTAATGGGSYGRLAFKAGTSGATMGAWGWDGYADRVLLLA